MLKIFLLLAFFIGSPFSPASATEWQITPETSSLSFTASQSGHDFTGHFNDFTANITLDPQNLSTAHIRITIDMTSFDAGNTDRNNALPSADWFHNRAFPTATFTSDTITNSGGNQYQATGSLTIKDITLPLTLPFTLDISNNTAPPTAHATGSTTLNRTDYQIGTGQWENDRWVGFTVEVNFDLNATQIP